LPLLTNLHIIKEIAAEKEPENDAFRIFLKQQDGKLTDAIVNRLNEEITPQIDCTQCGNCCKSLMINVTPAEVHALATHLKYDVAAIKEKYIETGIEGELIINTIPCHFLNGTSCSIYENRFTECREFPHLHKANFTGRLFGTLMNYATCPIIFNVIESLKQKLAFKQS
jgi:uncharacterized protein